MRSASSSRAPSRAATALTASLSMFRTSVPRIDASTFSSLTVVPNVGLARRASAAVCERGGGAFREAEPRSGGSDRVDRIAPRGGRWHPGRRVASCGVAWRGDASARRLSRRPPGPPLRRPGARDRRTRRARDLREQVVTKLDAPLEERVQVLGEALVAQDAGAEVRRELAERVRKGLRISLRETRSALFCDAPCDSPCCGSARSSDPWRRSWLRRQYVWRRCVRTDELGLVEVEASQVLLAKPITARGARALESDACRGGSGYVGEHRSNRGGARTSSLATLSLYGPRRAGAT